MSNILRKLSGLGAKPSAVKPAQKTDQQSADVANAAQRLNERSDQIRATLAELLKRNDERSSIRGL